MTYPLSYPEQRLIVNGVDLTIAYDMVLIDGFVLNPPEPKFYTVDIPGGNGVIDLTELVGGDVTYNNREQDFTFKLIYPSTFETTKTRLSNFLHGRTFKYTLTWDPGYTYKGRFSVTSYSHIGLARGKLGEIVIHVSADPYKYKEDQIFKINSAGGQWYYFRSGRKPVRPILATTRPLSVVWKDTNTRVGVGTYRLNDILFQEGINEVYINTYEIYNTTWEDIGPNGEYTLTWNEALNYTWDSLGRLSLQSITPGDVSSEPLLRAIEEVTSEKSYSNKFVKAYSWEDLMTIKWDYLLENKWTWDGVNYNPGLSTGDSSGSSDNEDNNLPPDLGGAIAMITYEWGDL